MINPGKKDVADFWDRAACGEELCLAGTDAQAYARKSRTRYELEPYIVDFADFNVWKGKRVLEIGVGLGADHEKFAAARAHLTGIDLTPRAVFHTRGWLAMQGLQSLVAVGDAESLPFEDGSFNLVFSWGVLHHSPNTQKALAEVHRVLAPGGTAKIMIYHKHGLVGFMLWIRYALVSFRPALSLEQVYATFLESPGTKAYSLTSARNALRMFCDVKIAVQLSHGDLLSSFAGQRHKGFLLSFARRVWPRRLIERFFSGLGPIYADRRS